MRHTAFAGLALLALAACETIPKPPPGTDADTAAWWKITGDLASDHMEGRDTGSAGYARAAAYVVDRFEKAGLKPIGENGGWYQSLPLRDLRVEKAATKFEIVLGSRRTNLVFLHQISVRATPELPAKISAAMSFRGYCSAAEMGQDMRGKVAICFGGRRSNVPNGTDRIRAAMDAGAVGIINVDDPGFTLEPARWPDAYARSVAVAGSPAPIAPTLAVMRLSAQSLRTLIQGSA